MTFWERMFREMRFSSGLYLGVALGSMLGFVLGIGVAVHTIGLVK
jgi:hypothetical protein